MTHKGVPTDPALAALVRRDVFGDSTPAEAAHLRSDVMLERWYVELVRVDTSINAQLTNHADGTRTRDAEWRQRAAHLTTKYRVTIAEARGLLAAFRARMRGGDVGALETEVGRLRGAINAHQAATIAADVDPEPWDEALWANLEHRAKRHRGGRVTEDRPPPPDEDDDDPETMQPCAGCAWTVSRCSDGTWAHDEGGYPHDHDPGPAGNRPLTVPEAEAMFAAVDEARAMRHDGPDTLTG